MKANTFIIIIAFLSFSLSAQKYNVPQAELKGLDGCTASSSEIINSSTEALVVLWGHVKTSDQDELEKIQTAWKNSLKPSGIKMIVICAGNIASKTRLTALAEDRNWEFEMYFDYHGEFSSGLKIVNTPAILFFGKNQTLICHNHINCPGKINLICKNIQENLESLTQNTVRIYDSSKYQCQSPPSGNLRLW